MATAPARPHPSITESPWYWVYLFCTAGLVALVVMGPKFASRQAQIERSAQGRQRAMQNLEGREPVTPMSETGRTQIGLRPLYVVLGVLLAAAWVRLARQHLQRRRELRLAGGETDAPATKHEPQAPPSGLAGHHGSGP